MSRSPRNCGKEREEGNERKRVSCKGREEGRKKKTTIFLLVNAEYLKKKNRGDRSSSTGRRYSATEIEGFRKFDTKDIEGEVGGGVKEHLERHRGREHLAPKKKTWMVHSILKTLKNERAEAQKKEQLDSPNT